MNKRQVLIFTLLISFLPVLHALAQPPQEFIRVVVAPDHSDWMYHTGESVNFRITVMKDGNPLEGISVRYEIKPELMETIKEGNVSLTGDFVTVEGGTMKEPGFLRCWAYATHEGKEYKGYATAGFDPDQIRPTTVEPDDFIAFWEQAKADLSEIPLDAKMTLLPERCTEKVNVYQVDIQNYPENARLYGILCVPVKPGSYPAILRVPGAGIRPYQGDIGTAERGVITLQIGIHGIPVTMEPYVYQDLANGALRQYPVFNLHDKDAYYYKRVYLGCVRAIDFIFSLSEFDGENLAVAGGSQGGALSIVTAGLDDRVDWLVPYYPALCDLTGYLEGRAGGWPHMFRNVDKKDPVIKEQIETSRYYDVVNFARHVKASGYYSWGFNDNVCPPTTTFSAYNVITAPKQLFVAPDTGHWTYPEQHKITDTWLYEQLGLE